jgi:hypothetical protein
MSEHGNRILALQVCQQPRQRSHLRFGRGHFVQITHEGDADGIRVVPLAVRPHSLKGARGMHCSVGGDYEVVRDVGVPTTLGTGSEILQRRVYGGVMDNNLSDGSHGESPVTDQ